MGSRLRRALCNLTVSPTTTPITLTLILSQDRRGDKRDRYSSYAKVSIKGEEVRFWRVGISWARVVMVAWGWSLAGG